MVRRSRARIQAILCKVEEFVGFPGRKLLRPFEVTGVILLRQLMPFVIDSEDNIGPVIGAQAFRFSTGRVLNLSPRTGPKSRQHDREREKLP
jgi:hypothetical protein